MSRTVWGSCRVFPAHCWSRTMQSSLLSFAVLAPKRAQRDGTLNSDDRRARRSGSAQLGHRHATSARGVVQGGGPDKLCGKKCYTNHCKKKISTVGPAPAWWSQGTALTGEEVLRHGMAHGRRCPGRGRGWARRGRGRRRRWRRGTHGSHARARCRGGGKLGSGRRSAEPASVRQIALFWHRVWISLQSRSGRSQTVKERSCVRPCTRQIQRR